MRSRVFLLAAAIVAIGGCASPADDTIDTVFDPCQPLVLVPDGAIGEEHLRSIDAGAAMWNDLTGSRLTRDDVPGAPRLPLHFEDAVASFHGVYEDEHGVIYINLALTDPHERAVTIAHEVGHAFGLLHVDRGERLSVMNQGNLDVEPAVEDRAALSLLWGACR